MKLIIGNQNYSSWSLRPWALLKYFEIDFQQHKIYLFTEETLGEMAEYCPNNKVPVLIDENKTIWDSFAICEYINERYLANKAWPEAIEQRAFARAMCAEMHSGFFAMRNEMPMNFRREPTDIVTSKACQQDIERVIHLWLTCLNNSGSKFLFEQFSIVDAYYLPIVSRFISYQIGVPKLIRVYMENITNLPCYQEWLNSAYQENEIIESEEL